jgi:hypothetical protein
MRVSKRDWKSVGSSRFFTASLLGALACAGAGSPVVLDCAGLVTAWSRSELAMSAARKVPDTIDLD